jgi:hypothetical protein
MAPLPVLLSPRVADGVRASFANDPAIDSIVIDLAMDPAARTAGFDPDGRFVGVYRAPAGSPGDFVVMGGFADPDVANFALLNRRAFPSS